MDLDLEQIIAVESEVDTLVLAGPGSGKTTVLEAKAHKEVRAGNIVRIVTFTVSAADEIKERLGGLPVEFVGTLHAFALKILRETGHKSELCDDETYTAIKDEVVATSRLKGVTQKRRKELLDGAVAKTVLESLFVKSVHQIINESGLITYDGILQEATKYLSAQVLWSYKGASCVYLVDEVQDSSQLDLALYEALIASEARLWLVGDLQQRIFSFRSPHKADVWHWARIKHNLRILPIPTNYRSSRAVVKCCNAINAHFTPRLTGRAADAASDGAVYYRQTESVAGMLGAISKTLMALGGYENTAVLCRTNKEVSEVVRELKAYAFPVRTRAVVKQRVPEILWAALSVYMQPSSDWRVRRLLQLTQTDWEAGEREAAKQMQSLAQKFYPALLKANSEAEHWPLCMNLMAVPKDEQSWFYEHAGKDWREQDWPEIFLRLYESPAADEQGMGVTVSTIHSAKGREWNHVLMGYCDNQSFRDEEDDRVFFVGASRAVETLGFYWSNTRQSAFSNELAKVGPAKVLQALTAGT